MKARTFLVIAIAVTFIMSVVSFGLAAEKKPLLIGGIFSVTGKATALGDPESKTATMIVDQVNAAGGVNGFPLKLIVQDDESLENKAVADAEKLINQDRVLAIIGPSVSGNSLKIKPICEKAKIPMVSCAAAEAIVTPSENSRFIFKTPQLDSHVAIRILEQARNMGINKVGILTDTLPYGQQGRKHLKESAKDLGVEIVADETYGPNVTDMRPLLERIQAAGAGAVINWSVLPVQTIVPKNMKEMGMRIPLFHSHGFGNPKMIQAAGEAGEGIMFPSGRLLAVDALPSNHPQKRILENYKKDYESKYNSAVSTFGGHAYDAVWLVINAIKLRNVTSDMPVEQAREAIRNGLEETKGWRGIAGTFYMSVHDHAGLDKYDSLEMLVVSKGGKVLPLMQK